jgi:hypothetical protein
MIGFVVTLSLILKDNRTAFVVLAILTACAWSSLADAAPGGTRRFTTICGIGIGVLTILSIQLGLYFRQIKIEDVVFHVGGLTLSCSSIATSCMTNWVVFALRNIFTAVWHPSSLTVIKSPIMRDKVTKIEARVLHAAFHLKEASEMLGHSTTSCAIEVDGEPHNPLRVGALRKSFVDLLKVTNTMTSSVRGSENDQVLCQAMIDDVKSSALPSPRREVTTGSTTSIDGRSTKLVATAAIFSAAKLPTHGNVNDDSTFVRLLRPSMNLVEINTKKNVASVIFGESLGAAILDKLVYQNRSISVFMLILWMVGCLLGILSMFAVVPPYLSSVASFIMIPNIVINCLLRLNTDITRRIFRHFETWYIAGFTMSYHYVCLHC